MSIGTKRFLSNLCFANDVLLFTSTQSQLVAMLSELKEAAGLCGLKIHPEKTKILSNVPVISGVETASHAKMGGEDVEILPADRTTKYLGRR